MITSIRTLFISGLLLAPVTTLAFTDLHNGDAYYGAAAWLEQQGIVNGYPDGSFKPYQTINRAEFVKIVVGATFHPVELTLCDPNHIVFYSDTDNTAWYAKHLCLATQHKVVAGYEAGMFKPDAPINFVEAAKVVAKSYDLVSEDVSADPWYKAHVEALGEKYAIPGSIRSFDQPITRGEMAEMIYRLESGDTDQPYTTYENLSGHEARIEASEGWKVYADVDDAYSLSLPENWMAISPYDGSYQPAGSVLEDGFLGYGDPKGDEEIYLESFTEDDVERYGKSWFDFMLDMRISLEHFKLVSEEQTGAWKTYKFVLRPGKEAVMKEEYLFEKSDRVVLLGIKAKSDVAAKISDSFMFK